MNLDDMLQDSSMLEEQLALSLSTSTSTSTSTRKRKNEDAEDEMQVDLSRRSSSAVPKSSNIDLNDLVSDVAENDLITHDWDDLSNDAQKAFKLLRFLSDPEEVILFNRMVMKIQKNEGNMRQLISVFNNYPLVTITESSISNAQAFRGQPKVHVSAKKGTRLLSLSVISNFNLILFLAKTQKLISSIEVGGSQIKIGYKNVSSKMTLNLDNLFNSQTIGSFLSHGQNYFEDWHAMDLPNSFRDIHVALSIYEPPLSEKSKNDSDPEKRIRRINAYNFWAVESTRMETFKFEELSVFRLAQCFNTAFDRVTMDNFLTFRFEETKRAPLTFIIKLLTYFTERSVQRENDNETLRKFRSIFFSGVVHSHDEVGQKRDSHEFQTSFKEANAQAQLDIKVLDQLFIKYRSTPEVKQLIMTMLIAYHMFRKLDILAVSKADPTFKALITGTNEDVNSAVSTGPFTRGDNSRDNAVQVYGGFKNNFFSRMDIHSFPGQVEFGCSNVPYGEVSVMDSFIKNCGEDKILFVDAQYKRFYDAYQGAAKVYVAPPLSHSKYNVIPIGTESFENHVQRVLDDRLNKLGYTNAEDNFEVTPDQLVIIVVAQKIKNDQIVQIHSIITSILSKLPQKIRFQFTVVLPFERIGQTNSSLIQMGTPTTSFSLRKAELISLRNMDGGFVMFATIFGNHSFINSDVKYEALRVALDHYVQRIFLMKMSSFVGSLVNGVSGRLPSNISLVLNEMTIADSSGVVSKEVQEHSLKALADGDKLLL